MKKIIAIVLALVMTFALSITTFAAAPEGVEVAAPSKNAFPTDTEEEYDVNGTFNLVDVATVYYVTVEWTDMAFSFNYDLTWNPVTLQYEVENIQWVDNVATVTVNNRSNKAIDAQVVFDAAANYTGVTAAYEKVVEGDDPEVGNQFTLTSAEKQNGARKVTGVTGTKTTATVTITASGTINAAYVGANETTAQTYAIGTVTVTISAHVDNP